MPAPNGKHRLPVITNSEMTTFGRCIREWYLAYVLGYRSAYQAEALRFGSLWHACLELYWLGHGLEAALAFATAHAESVVEAVRARVLLRGYDVRWGHELHEVVGVEETFATDLINPDTGKPSVTYALGGKLDVRLTRKIVEHKTTSEDIGPGSAYWRNLAIDSQVSTYYVGAKSLGTDPESCIYDVVRKPMLTPKQVPLVDAEGVKIVCDANGERVRTKDGKKWRQTADTEAGYVLQTREETEDEYEARVTAEVAADPDHYFQRGEVVRLQSEQIEAQRDAWQTAQLMREAIRKERYPRKSGACKRWGGMCWAFDVCTGVATLEDTTRFVRLDNVHPELEPAYPQAAE